MRGMRVVVLSVLAVLCGCSSPPPAVSAPSSAPSPPPATSFHGPPVSALERLAGPGEPADLDVMSFNVRYAGLTPPNSWAQRRPVMRALLTAERPDLIGTQEGLAIQLRDIESDLGPDYDRIGLGRDPGGVGEHMAIFYNRSRLSPRSSGHFWLSGTPAVPGSMSWGNHQPRMVTWARFTDLATGRDFCAVNTHLDNHSEPARRRSAQLIMDRLATFAPLPIVLTGDFNSAAAPGSETYRLLTTEAGLRDTWLTPRRGPAWGTIHNYAPLIPNGERDDWILTSPSITTVAALMNTHRQAGQYPSDHLPIQARLHFPP
ncbi:endonuclease/exonuclease/phosphatase family protein [Actinoplanes subglobosus]|uniref:Endonuclease/exonuclease/phosphatase family protein n=1 Tax=Actinoplanes subglobosus TaxID=1547892 RepID=A0ABV8IZC6_9ACTN